MAQFFAGLNTLLKAGLISWLLPAAVFLAVLAVGRVTERAAAAARRRFKEGGMAEHLSDACRRPLRLFFLATGLYAAANLLPGAVLHPSALGLCTKVYRSVLIVLVAWVFCNLASPGDLMTSALAKRLDVQNNRTVLPLLSKVLRFCVGALAVLIIAQEWDFSISGLLAGLGLGGLAISLAAKDMLASMFGGLVILLDKPFKIGDWISVASIEGTVEDISFRSVKVRTFTQAVVTVPNATVVDTPVTNWSRMGKRRVELKLEVDAAAPLFALKEAKAALAAFLKTCKGIHSETATVSFDDVTDTGLLLSVTYFTRTTRWETFIRVREDVLLHALQILEEHHVPLAAPVREVRLLGAETAGLSAQGHKKSASPHGETL